MSETKIIHVSPREAGRYLRRWQRNLVNLPAQLEVRLEGGKRFTSGTAILRDISLHGARLGKIFLKRPYLPIQNFKIMLTFRSEDLQGVGALCRPVRFGQGKEFELAVSFEDLWVQEESK